jgi:putative protein kinase ArgK-like GTPase of G3E family
MIEIHRQYLSRDSGLEAKRRRRLEERVRDLVADRLRVDFWTPAREQLLKEKTGNLVRMKSTPYDAAEELLHHFREQ